MKILLLEDDYALNLAIKECLVIENYFVDTFYDGMEAYDALLNSYDLFILDINVPNINGIDVLLKIKESNPNAKVIMISANIDINTLKKAYAKGCDDYIKKPFDIDELILKINKIGSEQTITINENCKYLFEEKRIFVNNQEVHLTKHESDLLHFFILNKNCVITKEQISQYVYNEKMPLDSTVRSLLRRLRSKLPEDLIETLVSRGYKFNMQ